jgi:hypothetical protein
MRKSTLTTRRALLCGVLLIVTACASARGAVLVSTNIVTEEFRVPSDAGINI